jgi:hypothetical protein
MGTADPAIRRPSHTYATTTQAYVWNNPALRTDPKPSHTYATHRLSHTYGPLTQQPGQ